MAYCIVLYITNLVPWLLTRHLGLNKSSYLISSNLQSPLEINLILAGQSSRWTLLSVYMIWLILRLTLLTPFFIFMVFDQAQMLPKEETAIVGYRRIEQWEETSLPKKVVHVISRVGWRRLFRISVHIGAVLLGGIATFVVVAWLILSRLANRELILDWVVHEYLDFGLEVTIAGLFKNSFFWVNWKKFWVDEAGWRWFLGAEDTQSLL